MPRQTYQQLEARLAELTDELESVMDENQNHRRKYGEPDYTEQNALSEKVENLTRKLAALPVPSAVTQARFDAAMENLRKDFPMCHIEAWTPPDFRLDPDAPMDGSVEADWNDPVHCTVVVELGRAQDATLGTNWDSVNEAIGSALKQHGFPNGAKPYALTA